MTIRTKPPFPWLLALTWLVLLGAAVGGFLTGEFSVTFVGAGTFLLTLIPFWLAPRIGLNLPIGFVTAIAVFLCATLFLGEMGDFYERYWWWDVVLHGGSAVAFGLVGALLMLMLVQGRQLKAAPLTVAFFAFCFAVTIGALWEIWEFMLDQVFGLNTQKSGLVDTMWDLIVDSIGALIGAGAGWAYLKGRQGGPLVRAMRAFIDKNRRLFGG
ncbi:hypothetical protein [Brevundimonas vancanneytii]|jgi:uncharacterized membrane protein YjdF|uniref:Inner membrane protein yjdF n=1 Tax=Brevundimonas vancanneytii TaxID=1325724 RepID=A0A4P1KDT4_9CAUL|nr:MULTISPECIES: hypothetical protein [Brevundimonas]VTO17566.1 Uncharacterised protein [Brevundimonas vancanneytii]